MIGQISTDRNFSQLKGNGTGMSDDPCTDFDELGCRLISDQLSISYKSNILQEDTEFVGPFVKQKTNLYCGPEC